MKTLIKDIFEDDHYHRYIDEQLKFAGFEYVLRPLKTKSCTCLNKKCKCPHRDKPILTEVQAGVDCWITAKMAEVSFMSESEKYPEFAVDEFILIAGDGDFEPMIDLICRLGKIVHICGFKQSMNQLQFNHASVYVRTIEIDSIAKDLEEMGALEWTKYFDKIKEQNKEY